MQSSVLLLLLLLLQGGLLGAGPAPRRGLHVRLLCAVPAQCSGAGAVLRAILAAAAAAKCAQHRHPGEAQQQQQQQQPNVLNIGIQVSASSGQGDTACYMLVADALHSLRVVAAVAQRAQHRHPGEAQQQCGQREYC